MTKRQRDVLSKRLRYAMHPEIKERDAAIARKKRKERYLNDPSYRARRINYSIERKRFNARGITRSIYLEMLGRQNYSCAGCLMEVDARTGFVDHDHNTNLTRGILCHPCNLAANKHMTPESLRRLADYIEKTMVRL